VQYGYFVSQIKTHKFALSPFDPQQIKFGDNDTLAALVANLVGASQLVILTDQGGVYDADPRQNSDAILM
jgi:glutamate 5-kinase